MKALTEFLIRQLEKTELFEMAYSKSKFMEMVVGLSNQVLENWILVHYCSLLNIHDLRTHWCQELFAHLSNLQIKKISSDKKKALEQVFLEYEELDDKFQVKKIFRNKLNKEKDVNDFDVLERCYSDFAEHGIRDIIELVSKKSNEHNEEELRKYVYEVV